MAYSREDRPRNQEIFPEISLDKIRFGHRQQRREPLRITFMGQPFMGPERTTSPPPKMPKKAADDDPGYARFQGNLWLRVQFSR